MVAERWDEQVGSVADEAARLLESLRRSAADAQASAGTSAGTDGGQATGATGADAPTGGTASGSAEDSTRPAGLGAGPEGGVAHDPFCAWCPLCRGAAVVRSLSPETLTRLADLAGVAASVLADLASARSTPAPEDPDASATATPRPTAASRPIPVRDADDPQDAPRG